MDAGVFPPAWSECLLLAEPGTPVAATLQALVATAMQQQNARLQKLQQQQQQQGQLTQEQAQQIREHLELCLGLGWVAACARDVLGSFNSMGLEGQLRLFQICDPAGKCPKSPGPLPPALAKNPNA